MPKLIPLRFFSCLRLLMIAAMFFLTAGIMHARDEQYLRSNSHSVWRIIRTYISPGISPYSAQKTRQGGEAVKLQRQSPIDFKKQAYGFRESSRSFRGAVRSRSEAMSQNARTSEGKAPFYGDSNGWSVAASKKNQTQPRLKELRVQNLRETNSRIQVLIRQ